MIKVLDKSFAILEEIIAATPQPLGPLALAKKLGLNRTTCSRILRMLLDAGYIVQISRQAGYAAGPRIVTLNNMAQYQSRLLSKAVPMVDQLAERIGDSVLISQVCRGKRYVLYHRNCNPDREIRLNQPAFDDLYYTATGVVEMAWLPAERAMELYDAMPADAVPFPEFRKRTDVPDALEKIRREGGFRALDRWQGIFAVPLFVNRSYLAALGCSMPANRCRPEQAQLVWKLLCDAASELSDALSVTNTIG